MWTDYLLTYLVHSSLLLGGVWILTTCLRGMPAAWRESLWQVALLGGIVSAGAQLALGYEPFGGSVALHTRDVVVAVPMAATPLLEERALTDVTDTALRAAAQPLDVGPTAAAVVASSDSRVPWFTWLAAAWGIGVLGLSLRRWRGGRRLAQRIDSRQELARGPLREALDRLCTQAGFPRRVRLSEVTNLASPIALGTRRPEIVVPARASSELSAAQQEAMLAHELAHHVRHDPRWLRVNTFVSSMLFFQPLNLLARRRLGQVAELLADEYAVAWTGRTRELAECLTAVARWAVHGSRPLAASAMAQPGSMLELRVATLLQRRAAPGRARRGVRLLAILPLILVAVFAPAITSRAAVPEGPTAAEIPTALPHSQPAGTAAQAMVLLDEEIAALEAEMKPLLGLLEQIETAPPALTRGVARLHRHLAALLIQRNVLVLAARTPLEKNR